MKTQTSNTSQLERKARDIYNKTSNLQEVRRLKVVTPMGF